MAGEAKPTPIETIHPKSRDIIKRIDSVLASYEMTAPQQIVDHTEVDPMEIDRSPHTRHGIPNTLKNAAAVAIHGQLL